MRVFHGSYTVIDQIDLSKGKPNKDFGRGFYVTRIRAQAQHWAHRLGLEHNTKGFITEFEFNERAWADEEYSTLRFADYTEAWLDFVVLNRDDSTTDPQHSYDMVEGPVADDKVASRIDDYLAGLVSKKDFLNELKFHNPSHQICFCSLRSLQMLSKPEDKMRTRLIVHIGESIIEKLMSQNMDEASATDLFYTSKTCAQLGDASKELYKKNWEEIYQILEEEIGAI
jgi:hypothetical protein